MFDLDSQTVLQITKFARIARSRDGASLELNDPLIVKHVINHGLKTENVELRMLFLAIRRSLKHRYGPQGESSEMVFDQGVESRKETVVAARY